MRNSSVRLPDEDEKFKIIGKPYPQENNNYREGVVGARIVDALNDVLCCDIYQKVVEEIFKREIDYSNNTSNLEAIKKRAEKKISVLEKTISFESDLALRSINDCSGIDG